MRGRAQRLLTPDRLPRGRSGGPRRGRQLRWGRGDGDGIPDAVDSDGDNIGDRPLPGQSWGGDGDGDGDGDTPLPGGDGDGDTPLPGGDGDGSCASIKKEAEIT